MQIFSKHTKNKRPFNPQPVNHQINRIITAEEHRQRYTIELIASENFVSPAVLWAMGSVLTNKYAEGYPNHRYYHGCENVDAAEIAAIESAKKLFDAKYANVQPHSGSQANEIAYAALVKPGSKIMGMALSAGGHLSHGTKVSFSGQVYEAHQYGVKRDGLMDYDAIEEMALKVQPDLIVCGASAYSRIIDFRRFRKIADAVGAYLVADIAHIAGLVATGYHPSPIPYAHVVTTTVHKTLRGARGGLVLCNDSEISKKVNKAAFPGAQGGPLMHIIAGKAVAFHEALQPEFKTYIARVCANAKVLAKEFIRLGAPVVSGGTDNHLLVVDVFTGYKITGKLAADLLHKVGITLNMNMIPYDIHPPVLTSGVRIGTPAMTTRGFGTSEFKQVAQIIDFVLRNPNDSQAHELARIRVQKLLAPFT